MTDPSPIFYPFAGGTIRSNFGFRLLSPAPNTEALVGFSAFQIDFNVDSNLPNFSCDRELFVSKCADDSPFLTIYKTNSGYAIKAHNYGWFIVSQQGSQLTFIDTESCTQDEIEHWFLDQILPRVLTLHQRLVFHGSVVHNPACTLAFLGASGSGKSTISAQLCPPWEHMADDGLLLDYRQDGSCLVWPSYPYSRLNADSIESLSYSNNASSYVSKQCIKHPGSSTPQRITHIAVLEKAEKLELIPISQTKAFELLIEYPFRLDPTHPALLKQEFSMVSELVQQCQIALLRIPHQYQQLPIVKNQIRTWVQLRLSGYLTSSRTLYLLLNIIVDQRGVPNV
jgi:hypothetical protein